MSNASAHAGPSLTIFAIFFACGLRDRVLSIFGASTLGENVMITPLHLVRRLLNVLDLSLADANELASYKDKDEFIDAVVDALHDKSPAMLKIRAEIARKFAWMEEV